LTPAAAFHVNLTGDLTVAAFRGVRGCGCVGAAVEMVKVVVPVCTAVRGGDGLVAVRKRRYVKDRLECAIAGDRSRGELSAPALNYNGHTDVKPEPETPIGVPTVF